MKRSTYLNFVGGILVIAVSFALTTFILDHVGSDRTGSSGEFRPDGGAKLTSIVLPNGLRLTYPIAEKTDHGPQFAFDGSTAPNSFWEVVGNFPFALTVEFPQPKIISSYALDGGEDVSRMPTDWTVAGSSDGTTWRTLDKQSDVRDWSKGQSRSFKISSDTQLTELHFVFLRGLTPRIIRIYEIELHEQG